MPKSNEQLVDLFWSLVDWMYGGGKGDSTVECHKAAAVKIRFPQMCMAYCHSGAQWFAAGEISEEEFRRRRTMPRGTTMIREVAKVDGNFGSCYTCIPCLLKADKHERNPKTIDAKD